MMPGQYPHMPPPLPVKGLCVDGDDGHRPSSAMAEKNSSIGFKNGEYGGRLSTVKSG